MHRATGMVLLAMTFYIFFFWICGTLIMWGILSLYPPHPEMVSRNFSNLWVAAFLGATSFHNVGLTLTSDSLISYIRQPGVYLWVGILAIAGCTGLPIVLRCLLRTMLILSQYFPGIFDGDALRLTLRYPRLITYILFDGHQTRILVLFFVCINVAEFVTFYGSCSLSDISPFKDLDTATRVGVTVAKTVTIRNAGLEFVDARTLSTGMDVVYMISMWLSSAPFVSRMYVSEMFIDHFGVLRYTHKREASQAWSRFTHNFLFRHTVVIVLAIIILAFVEDKMIRENPVVDFFDVLFEVISAYGNVGLSMGFPGSMASLCGNMSTVGKLVLIFVMMVGKLRGLPTHSDAVSDFSFKELKFWVRKAKRERKEAGEADVSETDNGLQPSKNFEQFEIQRLHDGQLKKTLKTLQTRNVDTRLNKIQSFIQVHISISFSPCSAFVISVPC
jgi:Trk-type K+ transport system membrane component